MFTIKKQIALFLSIMLCTMSITSVLFAGHIETQQVLTPNGLVSIKDLKVGDLVISYNFNAEKPEDLFINTPIIKTQKNYADALYEIYIEDNRCISASPQQKFLVATQEDKDQESLTFHIEVIEAQYLTDSHMLLDSNLLTVPVTQTHKKELYKVERRVKKYFWKSIKHVKRKTTLIRVDLYSIELQEPHNYLIPVFSQGIDCKDDKNIPLILMHNGLPALAAGISLAFGSSLSSISFAGASVAAGGVSLLAGPAGLAIGAAALGSYALFKVCDKNHKELLHLEMSAGGGSGGGDPNDPKDNENNKIKDFEKKISKMSPNERVASIRAKADEVASQKGLSVDRLLSNKTGRRIYKDESTGIRYSVDTQHGRFEKLTEQGKHLGEVDFNFNPTKGPDLSGSHNLKFK